MHYHVLTLFPDMITQGLGTSIIGRAMEQGVIQLTATNIRDFSTNKHMKVDDYPYGGGAGMVMQAEPVYGAYQSVVEKIGYKPRVIYLTPQGKVFNQSMVNLPSLSLFRIIFWTSLSIADRQNGWARKYRTYFCQGIMPISKNGEGNSPFYGHFFGDRSFWKKPP